jgi:hypothetical protein
MSKETYSEFKVGDNVVYRESGNNVKCVIQTITYEGNLKIFELEPFDGEPFIVSVDRMNSAYCPWRFLDAREIE